jgi:RNA polymerase sigma-70 factor (ECF subfamily)
VDWPSFPPDRLAQACAQAGSAEAWEEFMRRYHPVITAAAVRASRQWGQGFASEIDDIVQEIYLRICGDGARLLTNFRNPRPEAMFGYMKVVATNIAHDYFRKKTAAKRGARSTSSTEVVGDIPAPFRDLTRQISLAEIDRVLLNHTEQSENGRRDRIVFQLYYRQGFTSQAISELPGIELNSKGVEGVLHRLTKAIRAAIGQTQEMGAE